MSTKDYDALYDHHVPLLNQARLDGDTAAINTHGEAIYHAAHDLVRSALNGASGPTGVPLTGDDLDLAVNAALDHIVNDVTRNWSPRDGISFAHVLTARRSSWREYAKDAVRAEKAPFKITEADTNVLRIARGFESDFTQTHGRTPTQDEIIHAVRERKEQLEAGDEMAAAKNKKKGFDASLAHINELLTASAPIASIDKHWEDPEGAHLIDALTHVSDTDTSDTAESRFLLIAALAGIDVDKYEDSEKIRAKDRGQAAQRLASPHAQWAFATTSH